MTTETRPTQSHAHFRPKAPCWPGIIAIPLVEFGKSLDDADLDEWFEAFAERNSDMYEYEISSTSHLLIREPTGYPGAVYEGEMITEPVQLGPAAWGRGFPFQQPVHPAGWFVLRTGCRLDQRGKAPFAG